METKSAKCQERVGIEHIESAGEPEATISGQQIEKMGGSAAWKAEQKNGLLPYLLIRG